MTEQQGEGKKSSLQESIEFHDQAIKELESPETLLDQKAITKQLRNLHVGISRVMQYLGFDREGKQPETESLKARRLELTKARGDHLFESARDAERAVIDFAQLGLRSVTIANGGALIAMLTFFGNFKLFPQTTESLWSAFALFVGGLFAALLATVLAYGSQGYLSTAMEYDAQRMFFHEYRDHDPIAKQLENDSEKARKRSNRLRWPAIIAAVLAAIAFATGSFFGLDGLRSASMPTSSVSMSDERLLGVLEAAYDPSSLTSERADIDALRRLGLLRLDGSTPLLTEEGRAELRRLRALDVRKTEQQTNEQPAVPNLRDQTAKPAEK